MGVQDSPYLACPVSMELRDAWRGRRELCIPVRNLIEKNLRNVFEFMVDFLKEQKQKELMVRLVIELANKAQKST